MKSNILIFLSVIMCTFSCNSVKMDTAETATKLVEFSKSPCYGKCPAYNLTIMTDGSMEYLGRRNVERLGEFTKQLDKETYKAIYIALKNENLYQYEDAYNTDILDGSKTRISYYGDQGKKAIRTLYTFPGTTEELFNKLSSVAQDKSGWVAKEKMEDTNNVAIDESIKKVFSYSQGACFGDCPSFSIDVFSDRRMMYIGKSNTKRLGIHGKVLSEKEYEEIMALILSDEFKSIDVSSDANIMDAQQFKVTYYENDRTRQEVKWKINNAEVLNNIKGFFQTQASSRGLKKETSDNNMGQEGLRNTVIISLSPNVKAKDWVLTKRHLGAKIVKFLSPNGTYFLLQVHEELDINRVKEELRRDKNVLQVQDSNRPAKPRDPKPQTGKSGKKGTATIRGNGN